MKGDVLKTWPEDGSSVSFSDLVEPLREVFGQAYRLERINPDSDIDYDGYEPQMDAAGSLTVAENLTAEMLRYDEEDQGRDAARVILGAAVRLGIEQGRRIAGAEFVDDIYSAKGLLSAAQETLDRASARITDRMKWQRDPEERGNADD